MTDDLLSVEKSETWNDLPKVCFYSVVSKIEESLRELNKAECKNIMVACSESLILPRSTPYPPVLIYIAGDGEKGD